MSNTRKIAYNTIVQIVGKVITTIISLFLVATLTRYLGVSGYGQYTTIFAFTQFAAVIADFGFFWYLVREISKPETDQNKIFNNVLTFRTFMAAVVYTLIFCIGLLIPQYQNIQWGIGIIAAASFWQTLNGTYVGIFQNRLRMDKAALTDVIGRLVILGSVLFLVNKGVSLNVLLWAYFVGNIANFIASIFLGRVYIKFKPAFDLDLWKVIFKESFFIFLVSMLGLIYFKVDTIILSLIKSSEDVGIYGPPYKIIEILILIPAIFMGNVFPVVTKYIYSNDEKFRPAFQKSFDFLVILAVPVVVGVALTSSRIIQIVAGKEFLTTATINPILGIPATSVLALQILIVAVGISFLSHLFGYIIIALGQQTKMIKPNLILVVFNMVLNIFLIPYFSYIGAAIVTVLTEILVVWLYWKLMRKYLDVKLHWQIMPKVIFGGIILGLLLYLFQDISLWYLIPIGVVIYAGVLIITKAITKNDFTSLLRKSSEEIN